MMYNIIHKNDKIVIIEDKGKYGAINIEMNKMIVDCVFDNADVVVKIPGVYFIKVKKDKCYGVFDENGKVILECKYMKLEYFSEDKTYWSAQDEEGNDIVIYDKECNENEYDKIEYCCDNLVKVKKNGKCGIGIKDGQMLTNCEYDNILALKGDYIYIKKDEKWGVMTKEGVKVADCKYEDIKTSLHKFAKVKSDKGWGFIDKYGKEICECKYEEARDFCYGKAWLKTNEGVWIAIDEDGNKLYEGKCLEVRDFIYDKTWIKTESNLWDLINENGEKVLPESFLEIKEWVFKVTPHPLDGINDLTGVKNLEGKWGVLARNNRFQYECKYDDVDYVRCGIGICENGKWGIMNTNGEIIVKCNYESRGSIFTLLWR